MPAHEYESELIAEQGYIDELYRRLDAERARAKERHNGALQPVDFENLGAVVQRDDEVRVAAREMRRLDVADDSLCFGRLDAASGERSHIGRIGLLDDDYETLLIDWRAPAARPFYTATGATPEGMRRRRQFHTRGRRLVDFTDEIFGRPGQGERGDAALLAAVNAPRGEGMRDIVATIQAEQDEIIRLDHSGVVVIEGGPGTGKSVVALHRVAYLLYTQREQMERNGVLVVGPNPDFLRHISRVLPSLGETSVVLATTGTLLPGVRATAEDAPEVAQLKGSRQILETLAMAIADLQRLPDEPIAIDLAGVGLRIAADAAQWARQEARDSGLPHNEARAVFVEILSYVLTERAMGRLGLSRDDREEREQTRISLLDELGRDESFAAAVNSLWPILTPEDVLAHLYSVDRRLARPDAAAWTTADVPLLDELAELLGSAEPADRSAERERRAQVAYAAEVLDSLVSRKDSMDDDDHLFATDMLYAEDLAARFVERDNREIAERAAADRNWTYRHVVVDEAQELSEMEWRMLMRRCPSRSFTIVGDLAQRRSPAGATSWAAALEPYVPGRWVYRSLTVNYRTPAEIMAVAAAVLKEFAPDVQPPESVRSCGVQPWSRQVAEGELAAAIAEFEESEAGREGTSVVIGRGGVVAAATKGLEFDAVLVVEPDEILADGPRGAAELYVALTRATQRLGVLHSGPLPAALSGLERN